jgi:hypothetical protein
VLEDAQHFERASFRLVAAGVIEAGEPPISDAR